MGGVILVRLFIGEFAVIPTTSMEPTIGAKDRIWIDKISYGARLPRRFADIPLLNVFTWISSWRECDRNTNWGYHRIFTYTTPKRGDIVVFSRNENDDILLVKRLVALSGDTLYIHDGILYVNGEKQHYPSKLENLLAEKVPFPSNENWTTRDYGPVYLPRPDEVVPISEENYKIIENIAQQEGNSLCRKGEKIYVNDVQMYSYHVLHQFYFMLGDNRDNSADSRFFGLVSEMAIIGKAIVLF